MEFNPKCDPMRRTSKSPFAPLCAPCAAALIALTGACATGLGEGDYPRAEVGRPMRLEYGVVERIRPVRIEETRTIVGPAVGAAVGGLAGSEIGGGDEERSEQSPALFWAALPAPPSKKASRAKRAQATLSASMTALSSTSCRRALRSPGPVSPS